MKFVTACIVTFLLLCSFSTDILAQDVKPAPSAKISIEGSTTVGPIIDALVSAFEKEYPNRVKFLVKKTGSGDGIAALIDGRCHVATTSRRMKPDELKNSEKVHGKAPEEFEICIDSVCFVVHPSNPVRNLSKEQVKAIYTGQVTNWKEVGGANIPIVAISRDTSSGSYEVFHDKVADSEKLGAKIEYANSNPQIFTRISTTHGAIGYVGLGFVKTGVAVVSYNGVKPTKQSIASGKYEIARPLYLYIYSEKSFSQELLMFLKLCRAEKGREIIEAKGFIPLDDWLTDE